MTAPSSPFYFVDTNIWLYAFIVGQDAVKSAKAHAVINQHANDIIISTQVINEVCVNLLKKAKFPEADIKPIIESFYARYQVAELHQNVLLKASDLRDKYKFSYWDSILAATALMSGASILFSEDMDTSLVIEQVLQIANPL
jgi:predicted nucleic acid-binding protein